MKRDAYDEGGEFYSEPRKVSRRGLALELVADAVALLILAALVWWAWLR